MSVATMAILLWASLISFYTLPLRTLPVRWLQNMRILSPRCHKVFEKHYPSSILIAGLLPMQFAQLVIVLTSPNLPRARLCLFTMPFATTDRHLNQGLVCSPCFANAMTPLCHGSRLNPSFTTTFTILSVICCHGQT